MKQFFLCALLISLFGCVSTVSAQDLAKRLILKDGSYQLATKWEIHGDRLRYFSAERDDWEEVPTGLVDWPATDKWAQDRAHGVPTPGAAAVDKEYAAEKQAEEEKTPHVAPGLRLPDDGGVALLDTFKSQPQLVPLQQNGGELNRNTKSNMLRAAINPIASAKQTVELPGRSAKVQAHVELPAIYVNVAQQDELNSQMEADATSSKSPQQPQKPEQPQNVQSKLPWDRFQLVRLEEKGGKRVVGDLKIAIYGKVSQQTKLVPTTAQQLTGGWVKITPSAPLTAGEYAVVESLGKEGFNLSVWDFGVNPSAPENQGAWKPDPTQFNPQDQHPVQLNPRPPQ